MRDIDNLSFLQYCKGMQMKREVIKVCTYKKNLKVDRKGTRIFWKVAELSNEYRSCPKSINFSSSYGM